MVLKVEPTACVNVLIFFLNTPCYMPKEGCGAVWKSFPSSQIMLRHVGSPENAINFWTSTRISNRWGR